MGCRFCASTLDGLVRPLLPSEMLDQVYAVTLLTKERVSNVVVMGMGEPLDNYDYLLKFIRLLTDENGLHQPAECDGIYLRFSSADEEAGGRGTSDYTGSFLTWGKR